MAEPVVIDDAPVGNGALALFVGLGFTTGLAAGFGLGYFVAKKRLETKYDKIAQTEIDDARDYYRAAKVATEARLKAPIAEVVEYLGYIRNPELSDEALEHLQNAGIEKDAAHDKAVVEGSEPDEPSGTVAYNKPVVNNPEYLVITRKPGADPDGVFENTESDWVWDQALEEAQRAANPGRPYVICLDEFGEDFDTVTYTFYEDDEVLADERDEVVDNVDVLIGEDNMQRWGHGSGNIHVILVRNEESSVDIEISKSTGSYAADVHGFLQHNYAVERMPRRRMRFDDEPAE